MLGQVLSLGLNIGAKLGVSSGSLWFIGLTTFLKLLDLFIDWRNADAETKRKYVALVTAMQQKALVSVKMKTQAEEMKAALDAMDAKDNEAKK